MSKSHARLVSSQGLSDTGEPPFHKEPLNGGGGDGTLEDMEARVQKLEDAFLRVDRNLGRMNQRFDDFQADVADVRISQGRTEERMERVMDKARDMPTEETINKLLNHKLTLLGIVVTLVIAALGLLPRII